MEKIIEIDDKLIILKAHAGIPIMYKSQFNRDFFNDAFTMVKSIEVMNSTVIEEATYEEINEMDLTILYNYLWVFAKGADGDIPPLYEWISQFENIPLEDIALVVSELISGLIKHKKKE